MGSNNIINLETEGVRAFEIPRKVILTLGQVHLITAPAHSFISPKPIPANRWYSVVKPALL